MERTLTVNGKTFRATRREGDLTITENQWYWLAEDGSSIDLTEHEISYSPTDE